MLRVWGSMPELGRSLIVALWIGLTLAPDIAGGRPGTASGRATSSPGVLRRFAPKGRLQKHAYSFDWDGDGIVTPKDVYISTLEADRTHRRWVAAITSGLTMLTRGSPRHFFTKIDLRERMVFQPGASDAFRGDLAEVEQRVDDLLLRSETKDGRFTTESLRTLTRKNAPGFKFWQAIIWRTAWRLFMSNGELGADGQRYLSRDMLIHLYDGTLMDVLIEKHGRRRSPRIEAQEAAEARPSQAPPRDP